MISGRGNRTEYVFGSAEGWQAFDVVRFRATEALSELFRYEIVLQRDAELGPVDIEELVGTGATLRIATEHRWRPVHGLVTEAALVDQTERLILYRVVLEPHAVILAHRRRCRTFVDRSLVEIVEAALEGLSPLHEAPAPPAEEPAFDGFSEPTARFRWALSDEARARAERRFTVQYNETDETFMKRLLEEEGLTFFFEHGDRESVLTITDRPGHAPLFARDARHELVAMGIGGAAQRQEVVRAFQPRHRLRAGSVKMRDYAWRKSRTRLEAAASSDAPLTLEHYEFPARDEDTGDPGAAPARFQLERFDIERHLSHGISTVRTHEPGYRFRLADRAGVRDEDELLLVQAEVYAQQLFPEGTALDHEPFAGAGRTEPFHDTRFEVVPANLPYRPKRQTPKPEITGLQSARVTAEELGDDDGGIELNNDEMGRVRVRFPWDQRRSRARGAECRADRFRGASAASRAAEGQRPCVRRRARR